MVTQPISVCMATFNGAPFLKAQIDSVLMQISEYDELIISDDSSTDETISIISNYNDNRIIVLTNNRQKGPIFNFENAISAAKHEIIFLCDQDDVWLPNKVSRTLEVFNDSKADLVFSDCMIVDENLSITCESYRKRYNFKTGYIQSFLINPYLGCCMAFRKTTLKKILPFPSFTPMHDIWIGIVCQFFFKVAIISEPLMMYRRHANNATPYTATKKSENSIFKKIKFRVNMIRGLCIALVR